MFRTRLHLLTGRSSRELSHTLNPYATYDIRGMLEVEKNIVGNIFSGTYDFYRGRLAFEGNYYAKEMKCEVNSSGLKCAGCDLKREGNSVPTPGRIFPSWEPSIEEDAGSRSTIEGSYRGYVYHDRKKRYQNLEIDIVTYPTSTGDLNITLAGRLYLGPVGSSEFLTYKFPSKSYPNPLKPPLLVLKGLEDSVDPILQITSIQGGIIRGNWYSRHYGKVGGFEVSKDGPLPEPVDRQIIEPVAGRYWSKDQQYLLRLGVRPASGILKTASPFFPLSFFGRAIYVPILGKDADIDGGSYDIYTDHFSVLAGPDYFFTGWRESPKTIHLRRGNSGIQMPIAEWAAKWQPFTRE